MLKSLHVLYTERPSVDDLASILEKTSLPGPGARVAIKPNLVLSKPSDSGATTDPNLVACIIEFLQARGHRDIVIIESSWVGDSTKRAFEVCGYTELSRRYNVPLVDLKRDKTVRVSVDGLQIEICREALEADFLINVPVLKAHCQTKLTCALKNLKGCIPDSEKRRFHSLGLHRPIAALNHAVRSHLTIVDGIIGDLTFEEGGTPVQMGRIIIGEDPVLVDTYAAHLLGHKVEDIPYIGMAAALGIGSYDLQQTEVIEHNQASARLTGAATRPAGSLARPRTVDRLARAVTAKDACSACYGSLLHALKRYEDRHGQLPRNVRLAIGQGFQGKSGDSLTGPVIGIGRCAKELGEYVPGCPPTAEAILRKLEEL